MTWALEHAPVTDPTQVIILIALADRAADDGTGAWPSANWIADRARCSTRTVRRHLVSMENAGAIRRGDQRSVAHLRIDRRPVVWDLAMEVRAEHQAVEDVLPLANDAVSRGDKLSGRSTKDQEPAGQQGDKLSGRAGCQIVRGDTGCTSGVTTVSYKPSLEPSLLVRRAREPEQVTANHFDHWWSAYPRKAGKGSARTAYAKASKIVGHSLLLEAAVRYRADPNRQDAYTAMPTTWLNQERWDDDPIPGKDTPKPSGPTPDAARDWLKAQWTAGTVKAIEERTKLSYNVPDLPDAITTGEQAREFHLKHRRDWITEHAEQIIATIAKAVA